jgi:hypothetical protein
MMAADDETSAEMEALRSRRLWHAYRRSDLHGPRSPVRRGMIGALAVATLLLLGAFVSGVITAADDDAAATTRGVPPTTSVAPTTVATTTTVVAATVPTTTTPPPTTVAPLFVQVTVPSTQPWTDTGLDLEAGQVMDVTASGIVAHNNLDPVSRVGADGDPRPELALANLVVDGIRLDGRHVGLIGRIGDGPPFIVGSSAHLAVPAGGRLLLGVNDNGVDNNEGAFTASITVRQGA